MTEQFVARVCVPGQYDEACEVEISDGIVTRITPTTADPEYTIFPGLADLHNHGAVGESFPTSDEAGCIAAARHHQAHGTTTLLASTVSLPREKLLPQLEVLAGLAERGIIDGIHAEGPFINACRCGAQDPEAIIPGDPDLLRNMIDAAHGYLRAITFAPETDHATELVDICARHNVIVSLGHTDASASVTAEVIDYAVSAGARVTATHLFNAMPPLHHRRPGAVAALISAAAKGNATVELVADGVHLDDATVDMALAACGAANTTFVSDAMAAAGQADGQYILGALDVTVSGSVARLTTTDGSEGAIAGGTSRVIDQVRRRVACGSSLVDALGAGLSGHGLVDKPWRARLEADRPTNFVVCDRDLNIIRVYRDGLKVG